MAPSHETTRRDRDACGIQDPSIVNVKNTNKDPNSGEVRRETNAYRKNTIVGMARKDNDRTRVRETSGSLTVSSDHS